MTPQSHFALGCRSFDSLLANTRRWLSSRSCAAAGYSDAGIHAAVDQVLVNEFIHPFLKRAVERMKAGKDSFGAENGLIGCGGVWFDEASGSVSPSWALLARETYKFLGHWLYLLGAFWKNAGDNPSRSTSRVSFLLGMAKRDMFPETDDARFAHYVRSGPIEPFRNAERLIVQSDEDKTSSHADNLIYAQAPLFAALKALAIDQSARRAFYRRHAHVLFSYIGLVSRLPVACLLGRALAYHALIELLNERRLIKDVIVTNGALNEPIWMTQFPNRNFQTHMVWFSMNSQPFVYRSDPVECDWPQYRRINVDHSWVWTAGQGAYLDSLGVGGKKHAVGPIVFYLPESAEIPRNTVGRRIGVFNITPVSRAKELEFGFAYNYYSSERMTAFIDDIVEASRKAEKRTGSPVSLLVKLKRRPLINKDRAKSHHDADYLDHLESLCATDPRIKVVEPSINLFSFIESCDAVVVVPYSSPCYIAAALGKPAVYYDPTGDIAETYETNQLIRFIAGRDKLEDFLTAGVVECPAA